MSQQILRNLERLCKTDTGLGVLPMVYSICKTVDNLNPNRPDLIQLVRHSRRFMILEESYFSIYLGKTKPISLSHITDPESIFFKVNIPPNLRIGFTKEIGSELVNEKYLKSFEKKPKKRGQYESKKTTQKNNILRALFSIFSAPRTQITKLKLQGAIPSAFATNTSDKKKERKKIKSQMKCTLLLIENLFNTQLAASSAKYESRFKEIASDFLNELHIPLAGLFRIPRSKDPNYVMYMLSIFEYKGEDKTNEEFHNLISNYFQKVFEKNKNFKKILGEIRKLNTGNLHGSNCFGKVLVTYPKIKKTNPPEFLCVVTMFGFNQNLITNVGFVNTPLHSLLSDYFYPNKKEKWTVYCPNVGASINIDLGVK